jgi:hypothetical protein
MEESAKKILIKSKINLMKRSKYIRIFLHISMKSEHWILLDIFTPLKKWRRKTRLRG